MLRWVIIWIVLVCLGGIIAGVTNSWKAYEHHLEVTVVILDGITEVAGSSVVRVVWQHQPNLLSNPPFAPSIKGEAPVVVLGNGRRLVALMGPAESSYRPVDWSYLAWSAYGLPDNYSSIPLIQKQTGYRQLYGNKIPAMVLFENGSDPSSGHVVTASEDGELAPGIILKGVTIRTVTEPASRRIAELLLWWTLPGRPSETAVRAWLKNGGYTYGSSFEPEALFQRGSFSPDRR